MGEAIPFEPSDEEREFAAGMAAEVASRNRNRRQRAADGTNGSDRTDRTDGTDAAASAAGGGALAPEMSGKTGILNQGRKDRQAGTPAATPGQRPGLHQAGGPSFAKATAGSASGRVLPHSLEAEEYLLSCCLLDGEDVIARCVAKGITPSSFFDTKHGLVFGHLVDMLVRQVPVDVAILAERLKASGELNQVGGYGFMTQISAMAPTTAQASHWIEVVSGYAHRRAIARAGAKLAEEALDISIDVGTFAAEAERVFLEATSGIRRGLPEVMSWGDLIGAKQTPMPDELVKGLLYRCGKLMLGGGSKSFKTWLLLDLGLSVANGKPFWGMETVAAPVLYVNFELIRPSLEYRVREICRAKGIPLSASKSPLEQMENFNVWNLRGKARDFRELRVPLTQKMRRLKTGLGILDPIYKCLGLRDENSNGDVGDLLNEVEGCGVDANCAMAHGHHFAKGDSSEKDKRDLTAGAGAWMRDPDSSVVLRPHEEEGAFVAEFILRDFEPRNPMVLKWEKPLMNWNRDGDPTALRRPGAPKKCGVGDAVEALGDDMLTNGQWEKAIIRAHKVSESTAKRLMAEAVRDGRVVKNGPIYGRKKEEWPVATSKVPADEPEELVERQAREGR